MLSSTLTYDQQTWHRPGVDELGGGAHHNVTKPRDPRTVPDARTSNQLMRQIVSQATLAPSARIQVEFPGGVPTVTAVAALNSSLAPGDFTITDNGNGDTSLTLANWQGETLRPLELTIAEDVEIDRQRVVSVANGWRVKTKLGATGTDAAFVLALHAPAQHSDIVYDRAGFSAFTAGMFWDTATPSLAGSVPNQYYLADPYARTILLVPAGVTSLVVEAVGLASQDRDTIGVWVNGSYSQTLTFTSYGTKQQLTVTLPGGAKTVELVGDAYLTGVSATSYAITTKPTTVASRCVVWGDSIGRGYYCSPLQLSFVPRDLRRSGHWEGVTDLCTSGDSLFNWVSFPPAGGSVAAVLSRFADCPSGPRLLFLELITNDYGGNGGLGFWSAASFGAAYAATLDAFHAADPALIIVCNHGFPRSSTAANSFGSTFADYRAQVASAVAARSGYCRLFDSSPTLFDGLHPDTAGHDTIGSDFVAQF